MLKLRIEEEGGPREVPLGRDPFTVGRGEAADVRIEEPRASREHLLVRPVPGGVIVRDLDSTNGTHGEEGPVAQARLGPGDRIRVGRTWISLVSEKPPPPRPPRSRAGSLLLTVLAPPLLLLLLVQGALYAVGASRDRELADARFRRRRAELNLALCEPDPLRRLADLRALAEKHAGTEVAALARGEIERLGPLAARIGEGERELGALEELARTGTLPFGELYYRYEKLLESYRGVPRMEREIAAALARLDASREEELRKTVEEVRDRASSFAARGEFGRALSLWTSFTERSPAAADRFAEEIRRAEKEIRNAAEEDYRRLLEQVKTLRPEEAAALLGREASRFTGTRFRPLLGLKARPPRSEAGKGAAGHPSEDLVSLRRSYHLLARKAEELAAAGLFRQAADRYAGMLETIRIPSIEREFAERRRELAGLADLLEGLKKRLAEKGADFGEVRIGKTTCRVEGLAGDTLTLRIGKGRVEKRWEALDPEEILALLRAARLPPRERLLVAVFCHDLNLRGAFADEILEALRDDALREEAGRLYARKEGVPYPPGGFVAYKNRILTAARAAEELHREKIGELRKRQERLLERLASEPAFRGLSKLRKLRAELDAARKHALELIFDRVKYFYPYRDRMKEYTPVQEEVDRRVAAVREIWDDPLSVSVRETPSVRTLLRALEEANRALEALGADHSEADRAVDGLTMYLGKTLTVRTFFLDREEMAFLEYNRRILEWNRTVKSEATDPERKQVRVTNEYRMMMGRRALALDDRLVKTARGHSEEMSREGYFSHFSPHPDHRTPDQRARLNGYTGRPVSENIHRGSGSPTGAHLAWLHSSAHHRNILQTFWTEMGAGQAGKYWTQNFGRTKPKRFPPEDGKGK